MPRPYSCAFYLLLLWTCSSAMPPASLRSATSIARGFTLVHETALTSRHGGALHTARPQALRVQKLKSAQHSSLSCPLSQSSPVSLLVTTILLCDCRVEPLCGLSAHLRLSHSPLPVTRIHSSCSSPDKEFAKVRSFLFQC